MKQSTNKCCRKYFLSSACRQKDKIEKLEKMLQELHCKIRHVRHQMMLQEKVDFPPFNSAPSFCFVQLVWNQ